MISAGDFRNGTIVEFEDDIFQVVDIKYVKPESATAFVRTKLKDIFTGEMVEKTFSPGTKLPLAPVDRKDMQFLFKNGDTYHFMDVESYDQVDINECVVEDSLKFVKENEMVKVCFYKGNAFSIEPPLFAELQVKETEKVELDSLDTTDRKKATVETGAIVDVPVFVNEGDIIKIDTRTGEYLSRV